MVSATIVLALTVFHRLNAVPISNVSVIFGCTVLVCNIPVTSIPSPTNKFFVIATPPAVLILPLFRLVLAVTFEIINEPVRPIFPSISNAWSGTSLLIPTRLSTTRRIVAGIPFLFVCKSKLLPAALL